jgi:hypothetical protein
MQILQKINQSQTVLLKKLEVAVEETAQQVAMANRVVRNEIGDMFPEV